MNQNEKILEVTTYLFSCRHDDPAFDSDDSYEHSDAAQALIDEYGWKEVFPYWFDYLQKKCPTEDDVINFAHLFFYYGGSEQPLRDPYPFVSYLYYRVNTAKYGADATDIFDSIVIPLLSNIGEISLENETDYVPEKDSRILSGVEAWRKADTTG